MNILNCPYCEQKASSFLKAYFWGYFPGNQPNRCNNCSKPIKYNMNSYLHCGALFLFFLIIFSKFWGLLESFFDRSLNIDQVVVEAPIFDIFGFSERLLEIGIVFFILYISFEIPGKFFGTRIFKKDN